MKDIDVVLKSRMETIHRILDAEENYGDEYPDDVPYLHEFGLSVDEKADNIDYVAWVLSTGGPHEEIRFYLGYDIELQQSKPIKFTFAMMDWGEYEEKEITKSEDKEALHEIFYRIYGGVRE